MLSVTNEADILFESATEASRTRVDGDRMQRASMSSARGDRMQRASHSDKTVCMSSITRRLRKPAPAGAAKFKKIFVLQSDGVSSSGFCHRACGATACAMTGAALAGGATPARSVPSRRATRVSVPRMWNMYMHMNKHMNHEHEHEHDHKHENEHVNMNHMNHIQLRLGIKETLH